LTQIKDTAALDLPYERMLKFSGIVTAIGFGGFVLSGFVGVNAVSDFIFNLSAVILVAGPLLFLATVVVGLCLDIASIDPKPAAKLVAPGPSPEASTLAVWRAAYADSLPEGLRRERKGPLSRSAGRAHTI